MAHVSQSIAVRALALALCLLAASGAAAQPGGVRPLGPPPAQPVSRWVNIGPAPIVDGDRHYSGRVTSIAVDPDPHHPNHWLIGAALGGIWETWDAGRTWAPRTDDKDSLAIGAITFAPGNSAIVYAGTGDPVFGGNGTLPGIGVYKSTDGGGSWQLLPGYPYQGDHFSDIKVSPSNAKLVVAATSNAGIIRSTDGGATWPQKLAGNATVLEVHPLDFNKQYAGIWGVGVYRSPDSGNTWYPVGGPWDSMRGRIGRIKLALAPSDPNVLYVSIEDQGDPAKGLLGVWRTTLAWRDAPWEPILNAGSGYGQRTDYNHAIIVDPMNPNVLYGGWVNLWRFDGTSWTPAQHGIHDDQHRMVWAGHRLIVGNDGGVWSTTDGGATWTDHNTGLSITQFLTGSVHPTNPNFILAGSQDNGTEKFTGTSSWQFLRDGDGATTAISPSMPDTHWAVSVDYEIWRTKNGDDGFGAAPAAGAAPFAMCPTNEDIFIARGGTLMKSTNFFSAGSADGIRWESNGPIVTGTISALVFAPWDPYCNTYAFGTDKGELWLTLTGGGDGTHWINLNPSGQVPNAFVTRVVFDPSDHNTLYVTLRDSEENRLNHTGYAYKGINIMSPTWQPIAAAPNLNYYTLAIDPLDRDVLYLGTDRGVWKSTTGGSSWSPMGPETGMPKVPVYDLKIHPVTGRVVAFTFGRGAFVLDRIADLTVTMTAPPGPVTVGTSFAFAIRVTNNGPDGTPGVTLTLQLPAGVTLVSLTPSSGGLGCDGWAPVHCGLGYLGAGRSVTVTAVVSPRVGGTITAIASVTGAHTDPNGSNNTAAASATVVGPDLVVLAVSNPPASARWNDYLTVTDTVQNTGMVSAGASTTQYYLSRDGVGHDYALSGSRTVPALAPSQSSAGTVTVHIPGGFPGQHGGYYYLLACADWLGAVAETNETNNCRASETTVLLVVPPQPSLPGCRPGRPCSPAFP